MNPLMIDATGSIKKQVTCESCGHHYDYEMTRTARGSFSGFAMTRPEADEKAALDAAQKLKTMLETGCDIVPCPKCDMLTREMEGTKTDFLPACFGGIAFGALIAGGVYLVGKSTGRWFIVAGIIGIGLVLLGVFGLVVGCAALLFGGRRKRRRGAARSG